MEGPTDDPAILEQRSRVMRSMLTTLFTSHGTPLIVAGDEFGRTQGGNNNAYCQDGEISWLDWSLADKEPGRSLLDFTSKLIGLRKQHEVLRSTRFLHGEDSPGYGVDDVEWWDERGQKLSAEDWNNPEGRALVMRRALKLDDGTVEVISLLLNAAPDPITFHLPAPGDDRTLLLDSTRPDAANEPVGADYELAPQGAALILWTLDKIL